MTTKSLLGMTFPSIGFDLEGVNNAIPVQSERVTFDLRSAGVTRVVTADGFVIDLRVKVKGVMRLQGKPHLTANGLPNYELDFEVIPTVSRALDDTTLEPFTALCKAN